MAGGPAGRGGSDGVQRLAPARRAAQHDLIRLKGRARSMSPVPHRSGLRMVWHCRFGPVYDRGRERERVG